MFSAFRRKRLIFLLTFFVIMIGGCEQQNDEKPQTITQKHADYLRLSLSDKITTFDPGLIYKEAQIELVEQLFLGLTDFNQQNEVIPELATDWQVSENGLIYIYKLRQDVKWTQGEPVTAHDVVWAIQRNIAKKTNSPYAFTLYILKNAKAIHQDESIPVSSLGARAIDNYTVEFTLEQPAGYFPALTGFWTYSPLPRKVIEQHGDDWIDLAYLQTNGSYQLTEWKKEHLLVLKKNPNYYEANQVKIPEVHYHIVPKSSLALAMYKANELDMMGGQTYLPVPQSEIASIESDPVLRKEKQIVPQFCTEWYGFNVQRPPMDNSLIRRAIAAVIDKKTLIDIVIKAEHSPAMTFTRPPVFGAVKPTEKVGIYFDPISAKAWLAEAGYPQGKSFPQLFLVHNQSDLHAQTAETVKTMLKHYLNINVEVRAFDFERYLKVIKGGATAPHIFRIGWCTKLPDAHNWLYKVFHPDKGANWVGWNNREFAKVVAKAQQISDPVGRKELYRRAEKILIEKEAAIVPLYFKNMPFLIKPWVKDWYYKGFGGQHIRDWSLDQQM